MLVKMANCKLDCSSFLKDGSWYKGEDCPRRSEDRRKILEPFEVPNFLCNQLCTDLNGYFGCESSVKTSSRSGDEKDELETSPSSGDEKDELETSPSSGDERDELETLGTSFHTGSPAL